VHRADNLTTFMCRLSSNLGASTSWNPLGLTRPVMELLYLYLLFCHQLYQFPFTDEYELVMEFTGCGKLESPKKTLPQCYFVNHRSLGFILGLCSEKPVSNCPSYTITKIQFNTTLLSTTK